MRLVSTLVRELEPQRLGYVERGLMDMAARVTDRTDLEMVVPELIRLLGEDSKALRALKMVSAIDAVFLVACGCACIQSFGIFCEKGTPGKYRIRATIISTMSGKERDELHCAIIRYDGGVGFSARA